MSGHPLKHNMHSKPNTTGARHQVDSLPLLRTPDLAHTVPGGSALAWAYIRGIESAHPKLSVDAVAPLAVFLDVCYPFSLPLLQQVHRDHAPGDKRQNRPHHAEALDVWAGLIQLAGILGLPHHTPHWRVIYWVLKQGPYPELPPYESARAKLKKVIRELRRDYNPPVIPLPPKRRWLKTYYPVIDLYLRELASRRIPVSS